ncbi:hypothetical protein V6Z12_A01G136800 [Gossypium hirsutum]
MAWRIGSAYSQWVPQEVELITRGIEGIQTTNPRSFKPTLEPNPWGVASRRDSPYQERLDDSSVKERETGDQLSCYALIYWTFFTQSQSKFKFPLSGSIN